MTTQPATHTPVMLPRADYPDHVGQTGCTCGFRPTKAAKRASQAGRPFLAHLDTVGVERPYTIRAVYPAGQGARSGMTWDEARAAGLDTRP